MAAHIADPDTDIDSDSFLSDLEVKSDIFESISFISIFLFGCRLVLQGVLLTLKTGAVWTI